MTIGDLNFPFPSPNFLFIHTIWVRRRASEVLDDRGHTSFQYYAPEPVSGYLTASDPSNEDSAGTERIRYSAVALLPKDYEISESSLIRCEDPSLPANLAGVYKIEVVRPNIALTRCLLVRYPGAWEEI